MRARPRPARPFVTRKLPRHALLGSTALRAAFLLGFALPAAAQPAPNARPQGGQVVAGQASIAQGGNATLITQSTDRAAINWQSFDVGAQQRVVFQQPGAGSVTLNRVVTPRPSEIAGRIEANGSVVLINSAGIVFHQGAQVEAQSFVASTADTTNAAFMAGGRLRLDRPGQPGARIENRGSITVREAGLAALVAPSVANSGTIRARLGTVVLAGAETHTIDLHGDGLVAFDITGRVRSAPGGVALVTNSGTVEAEGGTVLLTAAAADGLVQNLVAAGGTIRADSAGPRGGHVEIAGLGGSIRVDGTLAAAGRQAGERGGTIVAQADGEVRLGPTARVIASGQAGGGTVAIGTTAGRARAQGGGVGPENARRTVVEAGARINADATEAGPGGTVAVIGQARADHAGVVTARGGPQGGDGGRIEISSHGGFGLTGRVDTSAPAGAAGTLLLDPVNLKIVASIPGGQTEQPTNPASPQIGAGDPAAGGGDDAFIRASTIETLLGLSNVRLEASNDILVEAPISKNTANTLTLAAGNSITVSEAIAVKGGIALFASSPAIGGATADGTVTVNANLVAGNGNIALVAFGSAGQVKIGAGIKVEAGRTLTVAANAVQLPTGTGANNRLIGTTVEITPVGGAMTLGSGGAGLNLVAATPAGGIRNNLNAVNASGLIRLGGSADSFEGVTPAAGSLALVNDLTLSGVNLDLRSAGLVSRSGGTLAGVNTLTGQAGTGFLLDGAPHGVADLGAVLSAAGRISLRLAGDRTLGANVPAAPEGFHLQADGALTIGASIDQPGEVALTGASILLKSGFSLKSQDAAVVLTTTTGPLELKGSVEGATRVTIRSDNFIRNGNTLTTGAGGVVELATGSAIPFPVSDFGGAATTTLRIGAATAPFATAPTTTAASIQLAGDPGAFAGFDVLDLRASGAVTQTVPINLAGRSLAGAAGSFALTDPTNVIPTLGDLAATTGDLRLVTAGALDLAGTVRALAGELRLAAGGALTVQAAGAARGGNVRLETSLGNLTLDGAVEAAAGLELIAPGAVAGNGTVAAGTLAGDVGLLDLGGTTPVQVAAIGDLTAQGAITLVAAGALQVTGDVQSGASIGGGGGSGDLALTATVLRLGGSATAGNAGISGASIRLEGTERVEIAGDLRAHALGGFGGDVALLAGAGGIAQSAGTIRPDAGLDLQTTGGIAQGGGLLDAATLRASAGGAISLAGANRLDALGQITAGRGIAITNALALDILGPVRAGQAAGAAVELNLASAGAMTVSGTLAAGQGAVAGSIALASADGVLRGGGASPGSLTIFPAASLAANRAGGAGGRIALKAASATAAEGVVLVDRPLAVPTGGEFALEANGVRIGGPSGLGSLAAPEGRIQIRTDALAFDGAGAKLIAADGTVAIAPRAAGRSISIGGAGGDLALDATIFNRIDTAGGGGAGVLELGRPDGGDVTVVAATGIPQAPTLRLLSGGTIGALPGAVLKVGRLEGEAGAAIDFAAGATAQDVPVLGGLKAGTSLAFRAGGDLDVAGAVEAGTDLRLETAAGTTLRVVPGGSLAAGTGRVVTLVSDQMDFDGPVTAPGGRIEILPGTAGRDIRLGGAASPLALSLGEADLARLAAPTLLLGAEEGGAAVAGNVAVAGLADLTGGVERLRLRVAGDVFNLGGGTGLRVDRLGNAAPGAGLDAASLVLTGTANRIGVVDSLNIGGQLTIGSGAAMTVAGQVEAAGGIALGSAANAAEALVVTGSLAAGTLAGAPSGGFGDVLLLTTQGGLRVDAGGSVTARNGQLEVLATGGALTIAGGAAMAADFLARLDGNGGIALAGSLAAGSGVQVTASGGTPAFALPVGGSLATAAGDVVLDITGAATLGGTLTAAGNLVLNGGAIAGDGTITAGAVTGSTTSLALTGAANAIPVLGPFAATGGGIALNTTTALTLAGAVTATGPVTLEAASLAIPPGVALSAPGQAVALEAAAGVAAAGTVTAGTLSGSGGSGAFDIQDGVLGGLGAIEAGTFISVVNAGPIAVTGLIEAPQAVLLSGTTLDVAAGATVRATAPGGDVTLQADGLLGLAGTVSAPDLLRLVSLLGDVVQSGGSASGGRVQVSGEAVTQTAGTLRSTVADLAVSGRSFALGGTLEAARDLTASATAGDSGLAGTATAGRDAFLVAGGGNLALGGSLAAGRRVGLVAGSGAPAPGAPVAGRDLAIGGDVTAATSLTLIADGAASATGVLEAATLTGLVGGAAQFTGANRIGTLESFAAGATLGLGNAQALVVTGPASATGLLKLDVAGALTLAGGGLPFTLDAPALELSATSITQTGGALRTGLLAAKATAGGIALGQAANQVAALGAEAAGDVLLVTATGLAIGQDVRGTNLSLAATGGGILQSAGTLAWTGTATLAAAGAIRQTGGALDGGAAGLLTGNAAAEVVLTQPANAVPRLGAFAADGGFALRTAGDLLVSGAVAAGAGALALQAGGALTLQPVALSGVGGSLLAGTTLTQQAGGTLDLGAGALDLNAAGAAVLDGGIAAGAATIAAASLSQAAGGSLAVASLVLNSAGAVALDGTVTAGGAATIGSAGFSQAAGGTIAAADVTLNAAGDVALDGSITAGGIGLGGGAITLGAAGRLIVTGGGALDLAGTGAVALDGEASAGTIAVAGTSITQAAGGRIAAGTLLDLATAGDVLLQGETAAATAGIGSTNFTLAPGGRLEVAGLLELTAGGAVQLGGDIAAGTVRLLGAGIAQAAGAQLLAGGSLRAEAGTDLALDGVVRGSAGELRAGRDLRQGAGGDMEFAGLLTMEAGRDLALDGRVIAGDSLLAAGRDLTQAAGGLMNAAGLRDLAAGRDILLEGVLRGDSVRLEAGRDVRQAATGRLEAGTAKLAVADDAVFRGRLDAGLVTGDVGGTLILDGAAMLPKQLRDLSAGTRILVEADGPLFLGGTIASPSMIIRALGPVTIGELRLVTGGVPFTPPPPGSLTQPRSPDPVPGTPGATIETLGNRIENDRLLVELAPGFQNGTLALRLPASGGEMALGSSSVIGRSTDLTLDLGFGGRASGVIEVRNLIVYGSGGGSELEGTIGGLGGQAAAGRAGLGPRLQPDYRINNCPLSSVNCVQFVLRLSTPADPLRDLGPLGARDEREDPDIFVPNVAERDF